MQSFSLKPRLQVRYNDSFWVCRCRQIDNRWQFTNENGEVWVITEKQFFNFTIGASFSSISNNRILAWCLKSLTLRAT